MNVLITGMTELELIKAAEAIHMLAKTYFDEGKKLKEEMGENEITSDAYLVSQSLMKLNGCIIDQMMAKMKGPN